MQRLKTVYALVLALVFSFTLSVFAEDEVWLSKNSPAGAKKAYEYYRSAYTSQKDFSTAWKFARAAYFYANNFIQDSSTKKAVLKEGKDAAEFAMKQGPDKPEGYYFYISCLGAWSEVNGILDSLGSVKPMIDTAAKGMQVDPDYDDGAFYLVTGRVYQKAPAVISVGNPKKAEQNYKKALEYGPNRRVNYRFYAEFLSENGRKADALQIIQKGLALPYNEKEKIDEDTDIKLLRELQKKLQA